MEASQPGDRFQFSIRLLLITTAAVAAAVAAVAAEPSWQSCLALLFLGFFFASIAVVAAFKSRGALRVFWAAAAVPAAGGTAPSFIYGLLAASTASSFTEPDNAFMMITSGLRLTFPLLWCFCLANGFLCGLIYWLLWSRPPEPRRDLPSGCDSR